MPGSEHLQLIRSAAAAGEGPRLSGEWPHPSENEGRFALPCTHRVRHFLAQAAACGLTPTDAVRLVLERELVLGDAHLFQLDVEAARSLLSVAARCARPSSPLDSARASYVRRLSIARPVPVCGLEDVLEVALPERLITRVRGQARPPAFDGAAVGDMVAWELAGVLAGRTMGEWALTVLATARKGA